jgi:hypothetical protein
VEIYASPDSEYYLIFGGRLSCTVMGIGEFDGKEEAQ